MFDIGDDYMIKTMDDGEVINHKHTILAQEGHLLKTKRHDGKEIIYNTMAPYFIGASKQLF